MSEIVSTPQMKPREQTLTVQAQFEMLLDTVDIVSFDMFDTLIHRAGLFSPKDVFYQVQKRAEQLLGLALDGFPSARIRAEERARVRVRGRGRQEIVFDDIYAELSRMLRLDASALAQIKQIELACERAALTMLESGRHLFQAAVGAGKQVVIISDMYLDSAFLCDILQQHGYSAASTVYISSAYGLSKVDGGLYDLVVRELGCRPNRILHVGDNQLADVTMALSRGLRAFFVPTQKQHLRWRHGLGDRPSGNLVMSSILYDLSAQSEGAGPDMQATITETATRQVALLYFGYATWLLERLRTTGCRRVYFAARDGLIIKHCFDMVAATAGVELDTRYLTVSRASLYPTLIFTDPPMARRLFAHSWDHLTLAGALDRIGLRFEDVADGLARRGMLNRSERLGPELAERFCGFLETIWPQIEQLHREQYRLAIEYLRQEQLLSDEPAAFVDIGWHGSLQNSLLKLLRSLRIKKDLAGYYLGTFSRPAGVTRDFKALGFLCDNSEPAGLAQLVKAGPSLIELFHSAGHGSVLGYRRAEGRVAPIYDQNQIEARQYEQVIEPLQTQALHFIGEYLARSPGSALHGPDPALVARTALRTVYAPTIAEAATFGRLQIASDFRGQMKSITGSIEWNLAALDGELLPDGTLPIWRPGFHALRSAASARS